MKKLYFTLFIIFATINSMAQSPSEKRRIEQQKKAMEEVQSGDNKEDNTKLKGSELRKSKIIDAVLNRSINSADFDILTSPESFKKYSAVVLAQSLIYVLDPAPYSYFKWSTISRRRVIIQDKAALEAFSIFYTSELSDYEITLTKPSGEKVKVSKNAALTESLESVKIPPFFTEFIGTLKKGVKLPIQGLEVGDIIDMKVAVYSPGNGYPLLSLVDFPPVVENLIGQYPIVIQRFGITVPDELSLNLMVLNNGPEPTKVKNEDGSRMYIISDSFNILSNREFFSFPRRNYPIFKFFYSVNVKGRNVDKINKPLTNDEIFKMNDIYGSLKNSYQYKYQSLLANGAINYVKNLKIPIGKQEEIVKNAFYYLRTNAFIKLDKTSFKYISARFPYSVTNGTINNLSAYDYLEAMKMVLNKFKIPYNDIIVTSRKEYRMKDVFHETEFSRGLKVNAKTPIYLFGINKNSHYNEVYSLFEGSEILVNRNNAKASRKSLDIVVETVPESSFDDNFIKEISHIKIDDNLENLQIQKHFEAKGICRYDYYDEAIYEKKYIKSDLQRVGREDEIVEEEIRSKMRREAAERAKKEELEAAKAKALKSFTELFEQQNFEIEKVSDLELLTDGRYDEEPLLAFKIKTEFKNLVAQAGPNLVVSIGMLIGSQMELKAEDTIRTFSICQNYKRTYKDEIHLQIPEGYKVEDLRMLKDNVDNGSMIFTTDAEVKDNVLIVRTTKVYKKLIDPKENWDNYINALEASYNFSQKKVVLKKI